MQNKNSSAYNLKFLFAYPVYTKANECYRLHAHVYHELVLVQSGRFHTRVHGEDLIATAGGILLYTARTPHEEWAEDDVVSWLCGFQWDGFKPNEAVYRRDIHGKVQELLTKLTPLHYSDKLTGSSTKHDHDCLPILQHVLIEMERLAPDAPCALVTPVCDYIRTHMSEPLTVTQLANQFGLGRCRFTQLYHAATGRTPREEIQFIRIQEARRLIMTTALPLHEIAPKVGITNEYHLSRLIKKYINIRVRHLRKKNASD